MSEAGSLSLMAESLVRLSERVERIEGLLTSIAGSLQALAYPPVMIDMGGADRTAHDSPILNNFVLRGVIPRKP